MEAWRDPHWSSLSHPQLVLQPYTALHSTIHSFSLNHPQLFPQPTTPLPSTIHSSSLSHPQLLPQPSTAPHSTIHSSSLNYPQLFTQPFKALHTTIRSSSNWHPNRCQVPSLFPFFYPLVQDIFYILTMPTTCLCSLSPHNIPQIPFYLLSLPVYVYQSSFSVSATCLHAIPVSTACPHYLSTRLE